MRRYAPYIVLGAYVCGVISGYYISGECAGVQIVIFSVVAYLFIMRVMGRPVSLVVLLIGIGVCLGIARVTIFSLFEIDHSFDQVIGTSISCNGVITDLSPGQGIAVVTTESGSRIRVRADAYSEMKYGDVVECSGIVKHVTRMSLQSRRIFYEMSVKDFRLVGYSPPSQLVAGLLSMRSWFTQSLYTLFPSPHGELVAGMTIEGADVLSRQLIEQFRRTSLSHIVALSGTNVSIVITAVFFLCQGLGRRTRFTVSFCFVIFFAVMTGLTSTIIRAAFMALMYLIADMCHRTYTPLRALCFVSFGMVVYNPLTPLFDISFQLSFMATLSMVLVVPILELWVSRFIRIKLICETLVTTLSAQVFVAPLILLYTGTISLIAPLSNLLVLPVMPWVMLGGSLTVVLQYLGYVMYVTLLPTQIMISGILWVVAMLSALPFAAYQISFSISWVIGGVIAVYILIGTVLFHAYKKASLKLAF